MDKYYVSKGRLDELEKELEDLRTVRRREVAERLKQAKEYGDLSENSEYTEARDEQERLERRIFELEELLKQAVVIRRGKILDEVAIGAMVTVRRKDKTIVQYSIVGSEEARPDEGKISNESPLGKAFLGHKVGDTVAVVTPGGTTEYQITHIE